MATAKKTGSAIRKASKVKAKGCVPAADIDAPVAKHIADATVLVDRRTSGDRRTGGERRKAHLPVDVERRQQDRRGKVNRRRQIDPTTCERNYTPEEIEFMKALEAYKRSSGRMFPTCSEILEVLRGLGYEKRSALEPEATSPIGEAPVPAPAMPSIEHGVSA